MKRMLSIAAGLMLFSQPFYSVRAEDMPGKHPSEEKRAERTEKMMTKLTKELNLSPDQQKSVRTAMDERNTKMNALHMESGKKAKAIQEDTQSKINATLNDDQKKKYAAMKEEHREEMKEHRKERKHKLDK